MARIVQSAGYNRVAKQNIVAYGTTAVPLEVGGTPCAVIIFVPDEDNTGQTYWGGPGVTVANGIPVPAFPEGDVIPLSSTGLVYLISDTASQGGRFIALKA